MKQKRGCKLKCGCCLQWRGSTCSSGQATADTPVTEGPSAHPRLRSPPTFSPLSRSCCSCRRRRPFSSCFCSSSSASSSSSTSGDPDHGALPSSGGNTGDAGSDHFQGPWAPVPAFPPLPPTPPLPSHPPKRAGWALTLVADVHVLHAGVI